MQEVVSESSLSNSFVSPTVTDRVMVYDVLRGIAIVGILFANITYFGLPRIAENLGPVQALSGPDLAVDQITILLVNGKFRSMLAVLFGIGIWLQYQKRSPVPGNWPGGYLKRTALLGAIGLAHGIFLWYGDILLTYALATGVASLAVKWADGQLKKLVAISFGLAVLASLAMMAIGEPEKVSGSQLSEMARELKVFSTGSYFDQLSMRAVEFEHSLTGIILFLPFLLGLMFFGILLARHGVLRHPDSQRGVIRRMIGVGFCLGLPLCGIAAALQTTRWSEGLYVSTELLFGPLFAVGILALVALATEKKWMLPFQIVLARVGQMALSNYLFQTVVATAFFYSWGFGWFGKMDRLTLVGVAIAISALQLVLSTVWLRFYSMGPVEWLWRSLAEGRRFAILRREAA